MPDSEELTADFDDDVQGLRRPSETRDAEGIQDLLLRARSQLGKQHKYKAAAGSTLSRTGCAHPVRA